MLRQIIRADVEGCDAFAGLGVEVEDVDVAAGGGGIEASAESPPAWLLFFFFAILVVGIFVEKIIVFYGK